MVPPRGYGIVKIFRCSIKQGVYTRRVPEIKKVIFEGGGKMAGRPALPAAALKSAAGHRTNAEIETRAAAEKSLLTGHRLSESSEVKKDKIAHTEYRRVSKLLRVIGKDDALYSAVINRYCLMASEAAYYKARIDELKASVEDNARTVKQICALDSVLASKRRDMLAIEREMCLTVAAALRAIPKQPEKETDVLAEALKAFVDEED